MIKAFKWYVALTKRLFSRISFVLVLCIIPLCALTVRMSSQEDHGILTVALCCESVDDRAYFKIKEEFLKQDSVLHFYEVASVNDAEKDVNFGVADCAWVFKANFSDNLEKYISHTKNEPLCKVLLKEDTVFTAIAREKLYGRLMGLLAKNYSFDFVDGRVDADVDKLFALYDIERKKYTSDFVDFQYVNSTEKLAENNDYLASPLRGIICIAVMVCVLASVMCSINDDTEGRYTYFPLEKRFILHFASCPAGGVPSGIVAVVSMSIAGINVALARELIIMIMFIIALCGFSCTVAFIFFNVNTFTWSIPISVVLTAVLCPIFLNVRKGNVLSTILPVKHCLNAVYSNDGLFSLLLYSVYSVLISFVIYKLKKVK